MLGNLKGPPIGYLSDYCEMAGAAKTKHRERSLSNLPYYTHYPIVIELSIPLFVWELYDFGDITSGIGEICDEYWEKIFGDQQK